MGRTVSFTALGSCRFFSYVFFPVHPGGSKHELTNSGLMYLLEMYVVKKLNELARCRKARAVEEQTGLGILDVPVETNVGTCVKTAGLSHQSVYFVTLLEQ